MALDTHTLRLITRTDAHEGPVHAADEAALYFTSLPAAGRVAIRRLDLATGEVGTVVPDANRANGMTMDHEGRLVICEQGGFDRPARITRLDRRTLAVETLTDAFEGRPLNSPNDVVVARDGAVWFTDPSYGHLQGFRPAPALPDRIYRLDGARLEVAADGFDKPNGLAFSPANRVVLTRDARPGQTFTLAVFGINGPISASPRNYIWMRSATLDLYAAERAEAAWPAEVEVEGAVDATLEKVAGGFEFTEGPVWAPEGALLFSSPNTNVIYRWHPEGRVEVFRTKSGYSGVDISRYHQPGSNGLAFDPQGRL